MKEVTIPASPGDVLDRISILEIKKSKFANDKEKLANVKYELEKLIDACATGMTSAPFVMKQFAHLKDINRRLWDAEHDMRRAREMDTFDLSVLFLSSARRIVDLREKRYVAKRIINDTLGSNITEEKDYYEVS